MPTRIQIRRGLSSEWSSENPMLAEGEIGYETDTGYKKIGNGVDSWNNLVYTGHDQEVLFWTFS